MTVIVIEIKSNCNNFGPSPDDFIGHCPKTTTKCMYQDITRNP